MMRRTIIVITVLGVLLIEPTHALAQRQSERLLRLPPVNTEPVEHVDRLSNTNDAAPRLAPNDLSPWWHSAAVQPLRPFPGAMAVDVNSLVIDTLRHSAQVRAISDNAMIARSSVTRAAAEFDAQVFMESKFARTSVPTGSTLDAGFNVPRLREQDWFYNAGFRKKNTHGGRFEVAQRIGTRDSNSQFLFPDNQANSRLTLSYNHPLLNGAGKLQNSSLVVLANIDTQIASHRTEAELQDHLLAVTESMWELSFQRTILIQKRGHVARAEVILERLEKRREVDSLENQIARARAAVAMRRAELIRAETAVRNSEARLRALVNSPTMLANRSAELVPIQCPMVEFVPVSMPDVVVTALQNRSDINAAMEEIEAARVRLNVAKNELLPVLDIVLETYVSGLRGDYDLGNSWVDQLTVGEPSYTAGVLFEMPLHRRAAKANHERRQVELRQLSSRLQAAIETLLADVEVAIREVETTFREMQAKSTSMKAAVTDVRHIQRRWEEIPGGDGAASFLLADLLDAQDRLAFEESSFARAQVDYTLSLTRLNRATGSLLKQERIELVNAGVNSVPAILFEKTNAFPRALPSHSEQ